MIDSQHLATGLKRIFPTVHSNISACASHPGSFSKTDKLVLLLDFKGGAKGGLGGCNPQLENASPHRKKKSDFSVIFGIYGTLKIIF